MQRTFRYRLYPTPTQERALLGILTLLRELYNAALQERRDAYDKTGKSPNWYAQKKNLIEIREIRPEFKAVHTHLLQDALRRLDRAFANFFRRCKEAKEARAKGQKPPKPGYPRFKGRNRYKSFGFPDAANDNGAKLVAGDKRLQLSGVGKVKIKLHRPIEGRIKQVRVKLDSDGHWYAHLVCDDVPAKPLPATGRQTGIDVGIERFATFANGDFVANPRPLQTAQRKLATAQRRTRRRKLGGKNRAKARRLEGQAHAKVANQRRDFHHKTARAIVEQYDRIAIEDLNLKALGSGMLARQCLDAGWGQFARILAAQVESTVRQLVRVDPCSTSQECSECHAVVRKELRVRVHDCPHCGYKVHRDTNSGGNIEFRGFGTISERPGRGLWGGDDGAPNDPRSPLLAP